MQDSFNWDEITILIAFLNAQGIAYLMGSDLPKDRESEPLESVQFIQRLVSCNYPLVENASILLFILHPELDVLYQDVLNKIGNPPYDRLFPNLSQQQFSQNYQTICQLL
jgi:hypothetical protein